MGLDTSQTHLKPFTISSEECNCSVRIVNVENKHNCPVCILPSLPGNIIVNIFQPKGMYLMI